MASTVSAVRPPQRRPGGSGVGGALDQSHPCHAPVGGGGVEDKDALQLYITHQLVCSKQKR